MNHPAIRWCIILIFILSLAASLAGLFWHSEGQPYEFTSLHGEQVTLNGSGLYRYDSISIAAQAQANDLVTLVLGLPLLLISSILAWRGSMRGRLLLAGTIAYFLYTYMSYAMLAAYNELFLVYVALFALSLYAFILTMMSFDLKSLPQHFSQKMPRRFIAGLLFATGGFLLLAWLGRIVPALLQGVAPYGLESYTTLVIQAMDLALILPATLLSGVLLLRRQAWGYLLSSVLVMKFLTMATAVSTMGINEVLAGVDVAAFEVAIFPTLTLLNLVAAVLLLRSVSQQPIEEA